MTTTTDRVAAGLARNPVVFDPGVPDVVVVDEPTMSLAEHLRVVWRRRTVVLVVLVAVVGGTWLVTSRLTPRYEADAEVYISVETAPGARNLANGFPYAQGLARSYARVAMLPVVLGPVSAQLGVPGGVAALQRSVVARAPTDTVLIDVTATDPDRHRAAAIANAVADQLQVVIDQLSPPARGRAPFTLAVVSPASVPVFAGYPRKDLSRLLSVLLGLVAGMVVAIVVDDGWGLSGGRRFSAITSVPLLGRVARRRRWWRGRRGRRARRQAAEHGRRLRAGLARTLRRPTVVALTSTVGARAFGDALAELAGSVSAAESDILLVDLDLRRRALTEHYGHGAGYGVVDVLRGGVGWRDAVVPTPRPGVCLLGAGPLPTAPAGTLLDSPAIATLLTELRAAYDLVLVATPPVQHIADGLSVAPLVDGFTVIADDRLTSRAALAGTLDALDLVQAPVLGVVLVG